MGLIALLLLAAIAAGGSGKSTSTTKKKPVEPPIEPEPVVSSDPVSNTPTAPAKFKNSLPTSFVELGVEPGTVLKLNSVDPTATDWPGVRSLPSAWQNGALKLLSTLPYRMAMGFEPLSVSTSAKAESLYDFASQLDDAIKAGSVSGFGINTAGALTELLTSARTLERVRGYNASNRWGSGY